LIGAKVRKESRVADTKLKPEIQQTTVELRKWTREEYDRMLDCGILDEDSRVELIAGEIVTVAPQKSPHATAVGLGNDAMRLAVGPEFHVRSQMPLALGPDSEPEPDLAIVRGTIRDYADAHPDHAMLIIEVSDSTLAHDRVRKGSLYARSGIPEYWIVNLPSRLLEVYRDPAPDPAAPFGYAYRQRLSFGPEDRVSLVAIPGAEIAVADLLP
jgi:Uma2 family endonuclease